MIKQLHHNSEEALSVNTDHRILEYNIYRNNALQLCNAMSLFLTNKIDVTGSLHCFKPVLLISKSVTPCIHMQLLQQTEMLFPWGLGLTLITCDIYNKRANKKLHNWLFSQL